MSDTSKKKRWSVPKDLKQLAKKAKSERSNSLSKMAFDIFWKSTMEAYRADNTDSRDRGLKIADKFFFNIIRAEKNDDVEVLMELEAKLAELEAATSSDTEEL